MIQTIYEPQTYKQHRPPRGHVFGRSTRVAIAGLLAWTLATAMILAAIFLVTGCRSITPAPTTQQITAPATAVAASAETTVTRVEQLTPFVQPAGSVPLASAVASAKQTVTLADRAVASSAEFSAMVDRLTAEQVAQTRKLTETIADRDAKIVSQRKEIVGWESSWFGGKFWSTLRWITGIGAILVIAGLILNAKTDVLVYAAKPAIWIWDGFWLAVVGGIRAIGQLFGYKAPATGAK